MWTLGTLVLMCTFVAQQNADYCQERDALEVEGLVGVFNLTMVLRRMPNSKMEDNGPVTRGMEISSWIPKDFNGSQVNRANGCYYTVQVDEKGFKKQFIFKFRSTPWGPLGSLRLLFKDVSGYNRPVPSALEWVSVHVECAKDGSKAFTCNYQNKNITHSYFVDCNVPEDVKPHYTCMGTPTEEEMERLKNWKHN